MRRIAVISACFALAAGAAHAGTQFGEMEKICLATAADPAAALAAADSSGWKKPPADRPSATRLKVSGKVALTLSLQDESDADGTRNNICTVVSKPGDDSLFSEAKAWANGAAMDSRGHAVGYGFIDVNGRHVDPKDAATLPDAFDVHSHLRYLGLVDEQGQTTAIYTAAKSPN